MASPDDRPFFQYAKSEQPSPSETSLLSPLFLLDFCQSPQGNFFGICALGTGSFRECLLYNSDLHNKHGLILPLQTPP